VTQVRFFFFFFFFFLILILNFFDIRIHHLGLECHHFIRLGLLAKHLEWLIPKVIVVVVNIMRSFLLGGLHVFLYCVYVDFFFCT
jgi:hypothetical protein